jgi:catalase
VLAAGAVPHVVAPHKGAIVGPDGRDQLTVDRSFHTASSAEADALVIAAGTARLATQPAVLTYVQGAHRHHKAIAAWADGADLLTAAAIDPAGPGMVVVTAAKAAGTGVVGALGTHRAWDRADVHPTRDAPPPAPPPRAKPAATRTDAKRTTAKKATGSRKAPAKGQKKGGR